MNLDKTCIQCNDGNIRIVCSKERNTQLKIIDDSRFSIAILRVGNAAGADGLMLFSDIAPITSHELGLNPGLNPSH